MLLQYRDFWFKRPQGSFLGIDGLSTPADFPRLAADAVVSSKAKLTGVASMNASEVVAALDGASNELCKIADAAELCRNVHPDSKYVEKATEAVDEVATYMGDVNLDTGLYEGMRRSEGTECFTHLSDEGKTVLRHMRVSMEHEGIHLPDDAKAACLSMLDRERELAFAIPQRQEHLRNSIDDNAESGVWVPAQSAHEALGHGSSRLKKRSGKTGNEVFVPADSVFAEMMLKCCSCATTRRIVHEAQQTADEQGMIEMSELLIVRQQLARMRGYSTWGEYAQREALLSEPSRVQRFLDNAWEQLRPGLVADMKLIQQEKQRLGLGDGKLQAWDVPAVFTRSKTQYEKEEKSVSQYLSYPSLMKGVDLVLSRLLALSFKAEQPEEGEVWHPSVQKYTLREKDRILGILYIDPFMRPGKVVQSAQFTLQGSKLLECGKMQVPKTTLVYALPVGNEGLPMSFAITFMHEIGHAIHSLLSETEYQHLSGTRGTVDFVEFPSHLFEHFVLDTACLASYATHGKSGLPMPANVQRDGTNSRLRFAHFEAAQQLMYAAVDQAFYSYHPLDHLGDSTSLKEAAANVQKHMNAAMSRYDADLLDGPFEGTFTELLGFSRLSKFDHLVHYGGSYYCYMFNRALSSHVWSNSFAADPFSTEQGSKLRNLFKGGSVVQSLEAIETLLPPGAGGFTAEDVPLDSFISRLRPE